MIEGVVNNAYQATLTITVQGAEGPPREIEAMIDTGYNGFLTLPPALMRGLDLPVVGRGEAILADGGMASFSIHMVTVHWDDQARSIGAYAADTTPLIGMSLLEGHSLYVEVESGGRVAVEARPA